MLIATSNQLYSLENPQSAAPKLLLDGEEIQRVVEGVRLSAVALAGGGVMLLSGEGKQLLASGVEQPIESLLLVREDPLRLLIGTEGPHVYLLKAHGPAVLNVAFEQLDCRVLWHTPWGGPAAVRSLALTTEGWVYADIHVGSIMRSPDWGETWEPVTPDLHEDVHEVAICPAHAEMVYANTAAGVFVSDDRGRSWSPRWREGAAYGRAIAVHPDDPRCLLASVSDGPHGGDVHGMLFRSDDEGNSWRQIGDGFPASTPGNIDTDRVCFSSDGTAWAAYERTLYMGRSKASSWEPFWQAPEPISTISCAAL